MQNNGKSVRKQNLTQHELRFGSITFPVIYTAEDYHEFASLADTLTKLIGKKVSYKELDVIECSRDTYLKKKFKGIKVIGRGHYVAVLNIKK